MVRWFEGYIINMWNKWKSINTFYLGKLNE